MTVPIAVRLLAGTGLVVLASLETVIGLAQAQQAKPIASLDGRSLRIRADTLCLHGDTPGAAARARAVRAALDAAGIRVAPPGVT